MYKLYFICKQLYICYLLMRSKFNMLIFYPYINKTHAENIQIHNKNIFLVLLNNLNYSPNILMFNILQLYKISVEYLT